MKNEKGAITKDHLATFTLLLCPFAPHICEEMWEQMGNTGFASLMPFPVCDESKTAVATVELALQVCGKLKGTVKVPTDSSEDEVWNAAQEKLAPYTEGKTIVKKIFVKNRILNIVVK